MNTFMMVAPEVGKWSFLWSLRKWRNPTQFELDKFDQSKLDKAVRLYNELYQVNRVNFDQYLQERDALRFRRGAHRFYEEINCRENLLMIRGASNIWECLIGNGTGTAAQVLTYFNNGNAYIGVGTSSTAEANTQTDLQAGGVRVAMDATFPLHYNETTTKTITAASNATPISVTATAHGYTTGDGVVITGVGGNTATNGTWIIDVVDANTYTLRGSVGNGAYTSGGVGNRGAVLVFRSTFGSASANQAWAEFAMFNASAAGSMLNRKVASQGTKASPAIWQLTTAVSLA